MRCSAAIRCAGLLAAVLLGGCQTGEPDPLTLEKEADGGEAQMIEDRQQLQREREIDRNIQRESARMRSEEPTPEASTNDASEAEDGSALTIRDDGRPTWWLDSEHFEDGRVQVCAEVLGETMRDTRAEALEAARTKLVRTLGENTNEGDIRVERVWVWPLPNAQAGGAQYAGYVLISGAVEG